MCGRRPMLKAPRLSYHSTPSKRQNDSKELTDIKQELNSDFTSKNCPQFIVLHLVNLLVLQMSTCVTTDTDRQQAIDGNNRTIKSNN